MPRTLMWPVRIVALVVVGVSAFTSPFGPTRNLVSEVVAFGVEAVVMDAIGGEVRLHASQDARDRVVGKDLRPLRLILLQDARAIGGEPRLGQILHVVTGVAVRREFERLPLDLPDPRLERLPNTSCNPSRDGVLANPPA